MAELGRLQTVPAREVWPHEAHDFTPWLLQNVDVLSELLGMDLVLEAAEHPVGDFSLDLIGKDVATNGVVIVENQLEMSDHTHLGQIITYAAGTDPTTIVWLTTGFRPEHRAAIDWLNQRTDEHTRVFGVVIKVVQIGASAPAPAFELVAQPNDWEKQVRRATAAPGEVSARSQLFRRFWEQALERIRAEHPTWTRGRTSDQSWVGTNLGVGGVALEMAFRRGGLSCEIYFSDSSAELNQARFDALHAHRQQFEAALGTEPIWDSMEGKKSARVSMTSQELGDVADEALWPAMTEWLIQQQIRMRAAFEAAGGRAVVLASP